MTNGNSAREKALNNWTQEVEGTSIEVTNMMRSAYRDGWEDCRKLCADQPSESTDANYGGKGEAVGVVRYGGSTPLSTPHWDFEPLVNWEEIGEGTLLYAAPQAECAPLPFSRPGGMDEDGHKMMSPDTPAPALFQKVIAQAECAPRAEGPCEIDNFSSRVCQRGTRCCIADHIVPRADAETIGNLLGNLLARIHRDGGHYQAEHGTIEAIKAAEREVVKLRADAETAVAVWTPRDEIDLPVATGSAEA